MIRPAERQEIDKYLSARGLSFSGTPACETYIVEIGAYSMLLCCHEIDDGKCEVHIACPKDCIIKSRELCNYGAEWLHSRGYNQIYTAIPVSESKTAHNLCRRIGFEPVGCYNNHTIYERVL